MTQLPSGTVTFLFTDIEGSTKLWQQHPEAMPAALARHHALLNESVAAHGGYVFQIVGDAFCVAFSTATDGLDAALAAQRALHYEPWGETGPIRVRMALHTGAAQVRAGEYTAGEYVSGLTLSRTARLLAAGHGGQILLSLPTAELVRDYLPSDTTLREMGARRLKDLTRPEQIFQAVTPDLPADFAPLQTLDVHPHNLPVQLTSFVGREGEMDEVKKLLAGTHLLTLTGTGGTGKTRLALQVAADLIDDFTAGVWLIELAPLADPALLPQAVASVWDVREQPNRTLLDTLRDYVRAKDLLLILDNCEHLIEACAKSADTLLRAAPKMKILATSREALGIAGETTYRVPSLSLPPADFRGLGDLGSLSQYEAVRLFIDRVTTVKPGFQVTNENAPAVAQVCHRLDGIPLAIELAAARVRAMSVEQIATRLDDRFRLLTGGSRTALPRHQTLRALIDWSYGLLSEPERLLLRRLSVFAGGWTLDAAEVVCADDASSPDSAPIRKAEVLDLLIRLVDKSLVVVDEHRGGTRYRLLETIRQYARDRLLESDEGEQVRARHLDFFLKFAEEAEPKLLGAEQLTWLDRLAADHDNLRAALAWSQDDAVASGLRIAGGLWFFWYIRGYWSEWRERLAGLLARPEALQDKAAYAQALGFAGWLVSVQGDPATGLPMLRESVALSRGLGQEGRRLLALMLAACLGSLRFFLELAEARSVCEEGLAIGREIGDRWIMGQALFQLGRLSWREGNYTAERALCEEGLRVLQGIGDKWLSALLRANLGTTLYELEGDHVGAKLYLEESVAALRALGDKHNTAAYIETLGDIALRQGDYKRAQECFEESLAVSRELGYKRLIASALNDLGLVAQRQGNHTRALTLYKESLNLFRETGYKAGIAYMLGLFASLATGREQAERAARLFGAAEALRESIGYTLRPVVRADLECDLAALRAQLDEAAFNTAWAEGKAMTWEQAIAYALE